jgi:hypothetical protein
MRPYLSPEERAENKRAAVRRYSRANPELIRARYLRWAAKNKDKRSIWAATYRAKNKKAIKERQLLWQRIPKNRMRSMVSSRIGDCKRRGIPYNIEAFSDFLINPPENCSFCGVKLDYSIGAGYLNQGPSIDRVVPSKGYVVGNVTMLCRFHNSLKGGATASEHRAFADFMDKFEKC